METKKVRRTIEERRLALEQKLVNLDNDIANISIKVVWTSELRIKKGELNKDKTKNYTEKLESMYNWIAEKLGYDEDMAENTLATN